MKKRLLLLLFSIISMVALGQTTTVYLIRHAEKMDNSKNPELSAAGLNRAQHWNTILGQVPLKAIYSTDYLRTMQTAKPIALNKNLPIIKYDPKTIDIEKLKNEHRGQAILIVGHSNSTPDLANRIINDNVYLPIDEAVFGNLYIIVVSNNVVSHQLAEMPDRCRKKH